MRFHTTIFMHIFNLPTNKTWVKMAEIKRKKSKYSKDIFMPGWGGKVGVLIKPKCGLKFDLFSFNYTISLASEWRISTTNCSSWSTSFSYNSSGWKHASICIFFFWFSGKCVKIWITFRWKLALLSHWLFVNFMPILMGLILSAYNWLCLNLSSNR